MKLDETDGTEKGFDDGFHVRWLGVESRYRDISISVLCKI
jgi:hypothetical protein